MKTLYLFDDYYLPFLFPRYIVTQDLNQVSPSRKVILKVRKENVALPLQEYPELILQYAYSKLGLNYTILDRKTLVEFMVKEHGFIGLKKLEKYVEKAEDEDFKRFIILSVSMGKWYFEEEEGDVKIYNLFEALFESKVNFLRLYFEFRKTVSFPELWSSVLTFLNKARHFENQKEATSIFYARLLKAMHNQGSFRHFIELFQIEKPAEFVFLHALLEVK